MELEMKMAAAIDAVQRLLAEVETNFDADNRGMRDKYPRLKIGREDPVDVEALLDAAERLTEMGVEIDAEEVRERAGVPAAKPGGTVLQKKAGPAPIVDPANLPPESPQGGKPAVTGRATPAKGFLPLLKPPVAANEGRDAASIGSDAEREPDMIAATADEALGDWEHLVDPLLSSFEVFAEEAGDLSTLQERLAGALGAMDPDAFTELLARGGFAARIAGLADPAGDRPAGD